MADSNLSFSVTATTEQAQATLGQLNSTINDSMNRLTVQVQQASTATGSSVQKMVKGIGDASKDIAKSFDEAGVKASGGQLRSLADAASGDREVAPGSN